LTVSSLDLFEEIVRVAHQFSESEDATPEARHPFDARNLHPDLPDEVRRLFDDGHFPQATFAAFTFVDEEMQRVSGISEYGTKLMLKSLGGTPPAVQLNPGITTTEKSEQEGFKFLFAGAVLGIRNPRGHQTGITDDPDICLDHLTLASMLLRRLDEAGLR
jgi:uncharacterized protein (TIGR02391 family)